MRVAIRFILKGFCVALEAGCQFAFAYSTSQITLANVVR